MTNESGREVEVPLSFLERRAEAEIVEDGLKPTDLRRRRQSFGPQDKLKLKLAPSGGAVVRFRTR
jgi:hypothetical protein